MVETRKEAGRIDSRALLTRWMREYKNLIFTLCLRMTGDYFAAEDLTQETFLSAWEHLEGFDGKNEKAWLCRIAANRSTDHLRSRARMPEIREEALPERAAPEEQEPEALISSRSVLEELRRAVLSLPPPYRECAELYYLEGLKAREIAEKTGIGLKTVQSRLLRARETLKKTVGRELLEP